jgi:hypothetical protein
MMRTLSVGFLSALLLAASAARAQDAQSDSDAALAKTQALLRDQARRDAAVRADPVAQDADARVRALGKSDAGVEAIYELSAEILATLTDAAGGDPDKMMKIIQEAEANPEKLAEKLTPAQRAKLQELAKQLEATQPAEKPAAGK